MRGIHASIEPMYQIGYVKVPRLFMSHRLDLDYNTSGAWDQAIFY